MSSLVHSTSYCDRESGSAASERSLTLWRFVLLLSVVAWTLTAIADEVLVPIYTWGGDVHWELSQQVYDYRGRPLPPGTVSPEIIQQEQYWSDRLQDCWKIYDLNRLVRAFLAGLIVISGWRWLIISEISSDACWWSGALILFAGFVPLAAATGQFGASLDPATEWNTTWMTITILHFGLFVYIRLFSSAVSRGRDQRLAVFAGLLWCVIPSIRLWTQDWINYGYEMQTGVYPEWHCRPAEAFAGPRFIRLRAGCGGSRGVLA